MHARDLVSSLVSSMDDDRFVSSLHDTIEHIKRERESSSIGPYRIDGGMIRVSSLDSLDGMVIVGDIHGDLNSLLHILEHAGLDGTLFVFLGDYGDRGMRSVEVYYTLLSLKCMYPERIIMLRGNHEGPGDLPFYPHDLPEMLSARFNTQSTKIYLMLRELFDLMYTCVLVDGLMIILHGGVPVRMNSLDDIAYAEGMHPENSNLQEILWNDPREIRGYRPSARGYGYYFGKDITENALRVAGARILVRAHEPCDGYRVNHDGLVLTLFSCKEPYGNGRASYMHINRDEYRALLNDYSIERLMNCVRVF